MNWDKIYPVIWLALYVVGFIALPVALAGRKRDSGYRGKRRA